MKELADKRVICVLKDVKKKKKEGNFLTIPLNLL